MFILKLDLKCVTTVTSDVFLRKQEPSLIRHGFTFPRHSRAGGNPGIEARSGPIPLAPRLRGGDD